jgi:hypothetical protein
MDTSVAGMQGEGAPQNEITLEQAIRYYFNIEKVGDNWKVSL